MLAPALLAATVTTLVAPTLTPTPCGDLGRLAPGSTATCARLAVPADRERADGRTASLFVVRLRRAATPAATPVVFLQGGPGEAASPEAERFSADPLLREREIVLVDQRGTGRSTPSLDCPEFDRALVRAVRRVPRSFAAERAGLRGAVRSCHARLTRARVALDGVTSAATAADVADLRTALGVAQVDLWGVSYGTRAALATLRDHPDAVRAAILDSGTGPESGDVAVTQLAAEIRDGRRNLFAATGGPALARRWEAALRSYRLRPQPVRARLGAARRASTVLVTDRDLVAILFTLQKDEATIGQLPALIAGLRAREARSLQVVRQILEAATQPGGTALGAQLSVDCGDLGATRGPGDAALLRRPGRLGFVFELASGGFCDDWPVTERPVGPRVASAVPTLVVAGGLDPISPPPLTDRSTRGLTRRTLLTVRRAGHTPTATSPRARAAVRAFLRAQDG